MEKFIEIENEILPVTITKIKIGNKNLTKGIIEQIPWGLYVSYFDEEYYTERYGVPVIFDDSRKLFDYNENNREFNINGKKLLGYINIPIKSLSPQNYVAKYNKEQPYFSEYVIKNYSGKFYFIIWYDNENNLQKGYIDEWTANVARIDLKQIYII
jgi:hypothetical protein